MNIGIAVAINLGTNIVFSSISEYTNSIVGIMQLVLSMDYSIILMDRFTQEREKGSGSLPAMKAAIAAAFPAVTGSSLTTFAGLLCMVFMRFRLGADMGVALAKSVIVSLICIFTVLPSLILISEKWIIRTRKKALHIPSKGYAHFAVRFRIAFPVFFLILFVGVFFAKNNTEIQYTMLTDSSVNDVFGEQNTIVMLYETRDSDRIGELLAPLEEDEKVTGVTAYCNTLGKAYRADEIAALFGDAAAIDPSMIRMIYQMYGAGHGGTGEDTALTPAELIAFLQDSVLQSPLFSAFIDDSAREQIAEAGSMMEEYASKLEGDHYGRVILTTKYPEDSAEIRRFIEAFSERCRETLEGETWLIGTSVMNEEMSQTFNAELNRITLLSAAAIFLVIAVTFRSLILPLILVLTVQCGIYLTMAFVGLSGNGMFYLAILMVQCILMGATIDYGILFSSYYRDHRKHEDCPTAIQDSYEGSLHTILTSALIMIAGAGILGFVFANPAIGEVCLTISRGAISATLLIIFVLPGILAAFDRIVSRRSGSGSK